MKNNLEKILVKNILIFFYLLIITFLLYILLVIKYNKEFNFINYKYYDNYDVKKMVKINTETFKLKQMNLVKKSKKRLSIHNQKVEFKKNNKNNYTLNVENYYNRCSDIDDSYILEETALIPWDDEIIKKDKKYTINILPNNNWYINKNYCSYNLKFEINYSFNENDIIYVLLNGGLYKFNLKDLYEKK